MPRRRWIPFQRPQPGCTVERGGGEPPSPRSKRHTRNLVAMTTDHSRLRCPHRPQAQPIRVSGGQPVTVRTKTRNEHHLCITLPQNHGFGIGRRPQRPNSGFRVRTRFRDAKADRVNGWPSGSPHTKFDSAKKPWFILCESPQPNDLLAGFRDSGGAEKRSVVRNRN